MLLPSGLVAEDLHDDVHVELLFRRGAFGLGANGQLHKVQKALIAEQAGFGLTDSVRESVMADLRAHFRPEFLNRIDDIALFSPLGSEQVAAIAAENLVKDAAGKQFEV